jgi:hypothetical protein
MSVNSQISEYFIETATLYADRYLNNPSLPSEGSFERKNKTLELKNSIVEFNVYENIELPYLTSKMVVTDFINFKDYFKIKGTEKLKITLFSPYAAKGSEKITLDFIITGIEGNDVTNNVNTYVFNLVEEYAYYASLIKKSKTYKGKPHKIIENIIENEILDKIKDDNKKFTIDKSKLNETKLGDSIKYISPNINLLDIIERIKERSLTNDGAPVFVSKSMTDNKIHFSDLKTLLEQEPLTGSDSKVGFFYSQTSSSYLTNTGSVNKDDIRVLHVKSFTENDDLINTFKLAKEGVISSNTQIFDTTTGGNFKFKHNVKKDVSNILGKDEYLINPHNIFDDNLSIFENEDEKIDDIQTRNFSYIVSSKAFDDGNLSYYEERNNEERYALNTKKQSIKSLMFNSRYTITVPGALFFSKKLNNSVGSLINLKFFDNKYDEKDGNLENKERSGVYLIYRLRHSFTLENQYIVDLDIVKLNDNYPNLNASSGGGGK